MLVSVYLNTNGFFEQNIVYLEIFLVNIIKHRLKTLCSKKDSLLLSPDVIFMFKEIYLVTDGKLYVFGGCTSTCTTFNDLWTLDLTTRIWSRPVTTGSYPSPKASASMINYNNNLILFGGWTHPSPYPLHQVKCCRYVDSLPYNFFCLSLKYFVIKMCTER